MNVQTISIRGGLEWNEDALVVMKDAGLYGVLDGATSVMPYRGTSGETGGYLASNFIKQYIEKIDEVRFSSISLQQAVIEANAALRQEMMATGVDVEDKKQLWTTGIALIRINDQSIDYVQAGDCMIFAVYKNGTIRKVTHDQVAHIDEQTMKLWKGYVDQGMTSRQEIRQLVEPHIRNNKAIMNTLEGYTTLSGQVELDELLEHGTINRIQLSSILIVTDGLFPYSEDEASRLDEYLLFAQLQESGSLQNYAEHLIKIEESDPECQRYIRFKKSDDKTAVWIQW